MLHVTDKKTKYKNMKTLRIFLILSMLFSIVACNQTEKKHNDIAIGDDEQMAENPKESSFEFGTWITSNKNKSIEAYTIEFKRYKAGGIDELLINTGTDAKELERLVPIATAEGLKVHAWIM